jgi:hypothetical protein
MTDGLAVALEASLTLPDLEDKSFDWLLTRKAELLGNSRSLQELTQHELLEFHAVCIRLRQSTQPAGKPQTTRSTRTKAAKGPISMDLIGDDFA